MDGIAATRQLLAASPEARAVIVTNYNGEPVREAGACGYVLKENLIEVRRLLQASL